MFQQRDGTMMVQPPAWVEEFFFLHNGYSATLL